MDDVLATTPFWYFFTVVGSLTAAILPLLQRCIRITWSVGLGVSTIATVAHAHGAESSPLADAADTITAAYLDGSLEVTGYKRALVAEGIIRRELIEPEAVRIDFDWHTHLDQIQSYRGPFNCLAYWVHEVTRDPILVTRLIDEITEYTRTVERSMEGAILHPRPEGWYPDGGSAMLIDALQDYSFRLSVLGRLTGESTHSTQAVAQFSLYRSLLRDPQTGLWSQGRGWMEDPDELSPGAWSRGHGWLIRGMVDTLLVLPPESPESQQLIGYLEELARALVAVQQPSGMWHCLLHLPPDQSPAEVSGTALIAGNIAMAVSQGWLPSEPYTSITRRAFRILPTYVMPDGQVASVSPGPGPLWTIDPWRVDSFPLGDEHGPFAILFAAWGEHKLSQRH